MAVHIRLMRFGKKKQPSYRVVVVDSRKPRDGAYIESLGFYNPLKQEGNFQIDIEKYDEWIKKGAIPTLVIRKLIKGVKRF